MLQIRILKAEQQNQLLLPSSSKLMKMSSKTRKVARFYIDDVDLEELKVKALFDSLNTKI